MATYADILGDFQVILNRDDCTTQQAAIFFTQAMNRIQRDVKLPSMERSVTITAAGNMTYVGVPSDLLQIIDVFTDDWYGNTVALERLSYRQLARVNTLVPPCAYARLENTIQIRGQVLNGATVNVLYYGTVTPFASSTSTNELSNACPDLLIYAALGFAADNFEHPSGPAWEARYLTILKQVMQEVADLENTGGPSVVQPFYNWGE